MGRIAAEEVEVGLSIASLAGPRGGSDREVEGRSCDAGASSSSPTRVKDVLVEESAPKAPVPGAVGSKPGAFNRPVGPSETSAMFKASFLASLLARGVAGSVLAVAVIVVNVVVVMVSVWEGKGSKFASARFSLDIYLDQTKILQTPHCAPDHHGPSSIQLRCCFALPKRARGSLLF
jgi:hypothetical protein